MLFAMTARACIWDAETLFQEKIRSHDLAKTILDNPPAPENPQELQDRVKTLEANRDENNPDWWNNLAGAYIRLGQPEMAVKLLGPVISKFPNNYGIHANLGTAYHLLGRYTEAEKEIARDLEINPDGHFGLEKYHLALLQYLVRDADYQKQHVYIDEFSHAFQRPYRLSFTKPDGKLDLSNSNALPMARINELTRQIANELPGEKTNSWEWNEIRDLKNEGYVPPPYRFKWDLARDKNFEAGVIDMAQLNPKEPACFEMLGIAASQKHDYNLAVAAYEKAIALGSLKSEMLQDKVASLHNYIRESLWEKFKVWGTVLLLSSLAVSYYVYQRIRDRRHKLAAARK
jgi:tetratricopeptide (TPR) repeat protein